MSKRDKLSRILSRIFKQHGLLSSAEYDRLPFRKPSRKTINRHFGSWGDAVYAVTGQCVEGEAQAESCSTDLGPEVDRLLKQVEELTRHLQSPKLVIKGTKHKFGLVSDTHFGSLYADYALLSYAYDVFSDEGIEIVFNTGDLTDGIRMYRGHEFELSHHGADAQVNVVVEKYPSRRGIRTLFVCGNHDRSHWKHGGVDVGQWISDKRDDMMYLGYQEANVEIGEGRCKATVRLSHPEDGTAYAISYKPQQYVNALPPGTKPDVLLLGHYHKAEFLPYRGILIYQGGTTQHQTPFMRGRKIAAIMGFWIFEITVAPDRIVRVKQEFYPVRT